MGFVLPLKRHSQLSHQLQFVNYKTGFVILTLCFILYSADAKTTDRDFNMTISLEQLDLNQARNHCEIVGLDQNGVFNATSLRLDIQNTNSTLQEVWIGGVVKYTKWLNLRSCQYGKPFGTGLDISFSKDPVKDCIEFCDSDPRGFVLTGDTCFCRINVSIYDAGCLASPCANSQHDFCGKQIPGLGFQCMCQYKHVQYDDKARIGNCMTENYVGNNLKLLNEDCSNRYPYICREGHSDIPIAYLDFQNWTEAGFKCFRDLNKQFATMSSPAIQTKVWTSVFRKQSYVWGIPANHTHHCVSVLLNGSSVLSVHTRQCNTSLPVLCKALPSETETSAVNAPLINNEPAYVVIAVVCVVLFILVIIVLCFVWKRKRKNQDIPPSEEEITPPVVTSNIQPIKNTENGKTSNHGIEKSIPEDNNGMYSNLKKEKPSSEPNNSYDQTSNDKNHTYGVTQKGGHGRRTELITDYDTMASVKESSDTGNEYGHLHSGKELQISALSDYDTMVSIRQEEGDYGHLDTGKKPRVDLRDICEYDTNSMVI